MAKNQPDSLLQQVLDPSVVRQLRARLEAVRVERTNKMRMAQARVLQLEEDIARVALLSRAVTELFLKKGLFTKRELAEQLVATDIVDGALDFGLDPALALPGEERLREAHARRAKRAPAKAKAQKPKKAR
jgi:hypothetical protein